MKQKTLELLLKNMVAMDYEPNNLRGAPGTIHIYIPESLYESKGGCEGVGKIVDHVAREMLPSKDLPECIYNFPMQLSEQGIDYIFFSISQNLKNRYLFVKRICERISA